MAQARRGWVLFASEDFHGEESNVPSGGEEPDAFFEVVDMPVDEIDGIEQHVYVDLAQRSFEARWAIVPREADEASHSLRLRIPEGRVGAAAAQDFLGGHRVVAETVYERKIDIVRL